MRQTGRAARGVQGLRSDQTAESEQCATNGFDVRCSTFQVSENEMQESDSMRNSKQRAIRLVTAGAAGLALVAIGTISGVAHQAAASGTPVSYQATGSQAGNLSSGFTASSQADGWDVAVSSTQLFNMSHHADSIVLACHNQVDASSCWNGTKTVTGPAGASYSTPAGAALSLNQSTGILYAYVIRNSDQTAGVVSINTSMPASATGAQMFGTFIQLSGIGDTPIGLVPPAVVISGLTAPVQVGNNWYSFNGVTGAAVGTKNTLLCFNLVSALPCASQPFALSFGGSTVAEDGNAYPVGSAGTDVLVQVPTTGANKLTCFNTLTLSTCAGTWPQNASAFGGTPFPLLNTSGTVTGACLPVTGNPCYSLAGARVSTPPGMANAIGRNVADNGSAMVINNSVYVPSAPTESIGCYDYTTNAVCANFPKAVSSHLLYTVNPDPQRPTCLWTNSDSGSAQIQNVDALTGQPCTQGFVRIPASTLVNPAPVCQPTSYQTLQLTSPTRSSYASATVGFQDVLGNSLNIPDQPVDAFGSFNLSGLGLQASSDPVFVIRFSGLALSPPTFAYRLTWSGVYSASCTAQGQPVSSAPGYWMVASDGGIFNYGAAGFYGSAGAIHLNKPIVGMASTPNKAGYWIVASDGGIFSFGNAGFHGSTGAINLNRAIVGMTTTPTGNGYWLVASDGGIFAFGDAAFYGSTGSITLNKPIVGMAATQDGGGYWLVASDGGIFAYGDAAFYGSTGNINLNKPIVGIAANPNGGGYWMVASDGGIFSFGNAGFHGSTGAITLNKPIVGMASTFDAQGYWLVASDGGIFSFGDSVFEGSAGALTLNKPIVGMTS